MYGREQLEQDLTWLESQRAEGSRLLIAGKINGFQALDLEREIDDAVRSCKNKLAGVRLAITDREKMQKSGRLVYWKRRKGQMLMKFHGQPEWKVTNGAYLQQLVDRGYIVIELKGFPPRRDGDAAEKPAPFLPPQMRLVSIEEGRELAAAGEMVVWRPAGHEDKAAVVSYA
jgi:hypothetical protein